MAFHNIQELDAVAKRILSAARVPGAAIAIVAGGKIIYAKGFGYRDLKRQKAVTPDTVYPIASTSKAMNATLLGMLVDDGFIEWDAPVRRYLPYFHLAAADLSARVTLRDLVTMRTGLPRHDCVWWGSMSNRADIVKQIAHLDLSADLRQRFQYSNLSVTAAGHIAEIVTGQRWETLVRQRIFRPLGMHSTSCVHPTRGNFTSSFHETSNRNLVPTRRYASDVIAPAGGAVHSTVVDMTRWVLFNLRDGMSQRRRLISAKTLAEIHAPHTTIGDRSLTRMPAAGAYALGWLVDYYNGHRRVSHGGYLHDVQSSVMFFPELDLGMVSFINFGCPSVADLLNQYAFDLMMRLKPEETLECRLATYERSIKDTRKRGASVARQPNTKPSHPLRDYAGSYVHPGYGEVAVQRFRHGLRLRRHRLLLPLQHWHYDVWVSKEDKRWVIHQPHAFDLTCQIQFHADHNGQIASLSIPLEPEVLPIRFERKPSLR